MARRQNEQATPAETVMGWFREGRFSPLYLFYGEEDFLIDELEATFRSASAIPSVPVPEAPAEKSVNSI